MYIHPCIGSPGWGRCCCCCCCRRRSGRGAAAALRIGVESATPCGRGRAVWGGGVSLSTGAGNASLAPLFERTAARQRRTSARWWRARHARWRTEYALALLFALSSFADPRSRQQHARAGPCSVSRVVVLCVALLAGPPSIFVALAGSMLSIW
jgi:hypothetical protein